MVVIEHTDSRFPSRLADVKPGVRQLNYLGEWDEKLFNKCIAIVGSRRMTSYGERMIEKIVPVLVDAGVTVISGFMYGVDQKAHQVCIECGGRTIAVLGWGIDYIYDKYLQTGPQGGIGYQKIIDTGGLVLSEWVKEVPLQWMFPHRNRIVAGLSQGVLVVEASEQSGSLNTAKWAQKMGRILMALPGPATSSVTIGTNGIIKNGMAEMVTTGQEILSALNFHPSTPLSLHDIPSTLEGKTGGIVKLLAGEPLSIDELAKKLKKPVEQITGELGILELKGTINSRDGKYYVDQS